MKLLLDENLSPQHAASLRDRGHDAVSAEMGPSGEPDAAVRASAIESGRVLVTPDADFGDILRFPPAGTPGVIRLKIHPPTEQAISEQILRSPDRSPGGLSQRRYSDSKLTPNPIVVDVKPTNV